MREIVRRAMNSEPRLTAELRRRGTFRPEEEAELRRFRSGRSGVGARPLGPVQFATLLAYGDAQIAARAVLRSVVTHRELQWLDRLLKFKSTNGKRQELVRIVERAIEESNGNAR